jgi:hypothetical protein
MLQKTLFGCACWAFLFAMPISVVAQNSITPLIQKSTENPDWRHSDPTLSEYAILRAAEVELSAWEDPGTLVLNLFSDTEFLADHQRTEIQPNGGTSWIGKLEGQRFGYAIFSQQEGIFWGKVLTDDGEIFLLKPQPHTSTYQLLQIDGEQNETEDCAQEKTTSPFNGPEENNNTSTRVVGVCDPGAICSTLTIDVLVVYSPDARTALGGSDAAAQAAISMAIAELNTVNTNSNVIHSYALVHSEMLSYTESGSFSTDLDRLEDADDGFLDEAYDLRDYYYADLVALVLDNGGCGIGNVNVDPLTYYSSSAFSCTSDGCMTGNLTLSHELGHNMGFRHDRYAYGSTPSNVCDYAWGWVNPNANGGTSSQRWRTVMAYNSQCSDWGFSCTRIPHWSNPDINYNGDPTGSALGNADEASNAYLLDRSACLVDDFRVPVACGTGCNFFQASANYNPNTGNGPGNTTVISITDSFTPLGGGSGNVDVCIYYRGDHSTTSETFDVVDESGTILGQTVASNDCEIPTRVCFSVSPADYNSWIADGTVSITLDPTTNQINPTLCNGYNRASFELLVPDSAVPVEFSDFSLDQDRGDILVSWATAQEVDNDHFLVEHSRNGLDFTPVEKVAAAGNSTVLQQYGYRFNDASEGLHYFRVRQVDLDGTSTLTDIRSIQMEGSNVTFQVYPNPTSGSFFLSGQGGVDLNRIQVEVYDFTGKLLGTEVEGHSNHLEFSTSDWGPGVFYLRILDRQTGEVLEGLSVVVR